MSTTRSKTELCVLGAGAAGLGAAYLGSRAGLKVETVEKRDMPGGLSLTRRTADGYYHDLGGHRYYSPSRYLVPFLKNLLGDELIMTPRKSRFYLKGKFFDYPVRFTDVARKLPLTDSVRMLADYLAEKVRSRRNREEKSFEDWVVHRFGRALYEFNFENYTRKVWGVEPTGISADWASLRIKGLSLGKILAEFISRRGDIATLVDRFLYPRHGIGQIFNYMQSEIEDRGGIMHMGQEVIQVKHDGKRIREVVSSGRNGKARRINPQWVASSIDLDILVNSLDPPAPGHVLEAARKLRYRDLVIAFIRINAPRVTDDSWIYFPDESIPFGRWHEPKNWSPEMVPDSNHSSLVVEFFSNQDEKFWNASAEELAGLTLRHGRKLGLLSGEEIGKADKVLAPRAYPLWDVGYRKPLGIILDYVDRFTNLSLIGRNGRFYYCTIDESLISGFAAATGFLKGRKTGPEPPPIEIPDDALGYLGLSSRDADEGTGNDRWSRND